MNLPKILVIVKLLGNIDDSSEIFMAKEVHGNDLCSKKGLNEAKVNEFLGLFESRTL